MNPNPSSLDKVDDSRDQPLISFLTTAYQTEDYLAATIDSVRAQTCPDWQLVVVDNGGSDRIAAIVRDYADDRRIRLIRQENRGYRGGVTAASAVASGRFLTVIDSDDRVHPDFVAQMSILLATAPEIDAIGGDAELFYEGEDRPSTRYFASTGRHAPADPANRVGLPDLMREGVPCYVGAVRRDLWDDLGGFDPPEMNVEPDVVLWLRIAAQHADLRIVPNTLASIRQRPMSESRHPDKIAEFTNRIQQSFQTVGREAGMSPSQIDQSDMLRRLRYHAAIRRAREAFLAGDAAGARIWARRAFAQERTLRAALVTVGLHSSPSLLAVIHPIKHRVTGQINRIRLSIGLRQ